MPQQADVCIICALEEEANAVEQVICEQCQVAFVVSTTDDSRFTYRSTTITNTRGEPLTLALLCQMRPGPVSAAFDVGSLLERFRPCFVGMTGICAGDRRQVHLGDLVVAEYAFHFEEGKVIQDEQRMVLHQTEGITYGPSETVLQRVRTFEGWKTPVAELRKRLFGTDELPRCIMTLMASGMAVRGDDPFEMVQRQHRKTWALDMEAASLYLALRATPLVNGLVVKGVVDYADHSKDDTFHDFAARASAIYLLTFIQEYVTTGALLQRRSSPLSPTDQQNRRRMLRRVRATWIDGVLTQSLHNAARIELHLQDRPDVLANPWRLQVQETDQAPKILPDGTTIVQVYDRADSELLILGEPGSGKTTLLLELARTLVERAEKDDRLPMPIVFNLSSWAEKHQLLHVWLLDELQTKYQIPRKIGRGWIETDQILPLLDGLDEVAKEARSTCVEQINGYYQARLEHGRSPIVVCCRSEEYAALSTRVMLQRAVSILPLTDSQINAYLEQAGEQVRGLRRALEEDAELHNLARQPLMLNIFTLAYQGARAADIPTGETREGMQRTIFARYVERMLRRREQSKGWKSEQVIRILSFLAMRMRQHDQTIFSVENLQPTWLSKKWRILYQWCIMLVFGLVFGLVAGLLAGLVLGLVAGLVFGLVAGLVFGLVGGLVAGLQGRQLSERLFLSPNEGIRRSGKMGLVVGVVGGLVARLQGRQLSERLFLSPNEGIQRSGKMGVVVGVVGGVVGGLVGGLVGGQVGGLVFGLIAGLFVGLFVGLLVKLNTGIDPVEVLTWSWKEARSGLVIGLVGELVIGLVGKLVGGLVGGVVTGLVGGLVFGLQGRQLSERLSLSPNEGIRRSGKMGLVVGLVFGLVAGLVFGLIGGQLGGLVVGLVAGQFVGLVFGLLFGLTAFALHFILRSFLWWQGDLPRDLVAFLDKTAERLLLRKVGGSYIFVHRMLMDYFAELEEKDGSHRPSDLKHRSRAS